MQYYCYTRSEIRAKSIHVEFSSLLTVVRPACFLLGRSAPVHRLFLLFLSINRFFSGQVRSSQLFLLVYLPVPLLQSVDCLCSSTRPFCFSPSIVSALLVDNRFSSRHFHSSQSIISAVLVAHSASVRRLFLFF